MPLRHSRRRFLVRSVASALGLSTAGCGTILHPERRGQPAGRIDWGIVALDAVGLLFFFVPGVIAFAVDFTTGAIYLPPHRSVRASTDRRLERVTVPADQLSREHVERVVTDHVGQPVRLRPDEFESRPLETVERFWDVHDEVVRG